MYKKTATLCLLLLLSACPTVGGPDPIIISEIPNLTSNPNIFLKAESVSLPFDKYGMSSNIESSQNLVANVKLSDGSIETNVEWFSSDTSVATINKYGNIKSLKPGTSVITARSPRDYEKTAKLNLIVYSNNFLPKWSPSGDKVAFISNLDGKYNLYSINSDGSQQKQITRESYLAYNTYQWSTAGNKIVFSSTIQDSIDFKNIIHIIDQNSTIKSIPIESNSPTSFTWSPDDSKIAFIAYQRGPSIGNDLYTINSDGTNLTKIASINVFTSIFSFNWSPDSKKIAYVSKDSNLSIYDTDLKKQNNIAKSNDFCWLPDSSKIIYVPSIPEIRTNDYDISSAIFKINIDGTNNEVFLANTGLAYSNMSISPDKSKIILIGGKYLNTSSRDQLQDIFLLSSDGKEIKNLTNNSFNSLTMPGLPPNADVPIINKYPKIKYDQTPIWSPDNKYVALPVTSNIQLTGMGYQELNIISTETGQITRADIFLQDNVYPPNKHISWSSDSKKIVYSLAKSKADNINNVDVEEIYSLDINSSKITQLTNNNN